MLTLRTVGSTGRTCPAGQGLLSTCGPQGSRLTCVSARVRAASRKPPGSPAPSPKQLLSITKSGARFAVVRNKHWAQPGCSARKCSCSQTRSARRRFLPRHLPSRPPGHAPEAHSFTRAAATPPPLAQHAIWRRHVSFRKPSFGYWVDFSRGEKHPSGRRESSKATKRLPLVAGSGLSRGVVNHSGLERRRPSRPAALEGHCPKGHLKKKRQ